MTWRYGEWTVDHGLPFGAVDRVAVGSDVLAGDVLASGSVLGAAATVHGARHLRIPAATLAGAQHVDVGSAVEAGTVLAGETGRFTRSAVAPFAGRLIHVTAEGDFIVAPVLGEWQVSATLDGRVVRSDPSVVTVEGSAWCLAGLAAYGPDAVGALALAVDAPMDDLAPSRIDVRLRGRILVGGARMAAEAITRAHACGVAGVVAGAAPAGGLRVVYGEDVTADGLPSRDDRPTVLCLVGFGTAAIPDAIFRPFVAFEGSRASVHTASARLFVFAPPDAATAGEPPAIALADDHSAVRPLGTPGELAGVVRFPSEVESEALATDAGLVPLANILPFDAKR